MNISKYELHHYAVFPASQEYTHRDPMCIKQLWNGAVFGKMWWNV